MLSASARARDNPTLLPLAVPADARRVAAEPDAVELGDGLQAYRYDGLKPNGFDRAVTVYAAPTSTGVATLACLAPPDDADAFASTCDQMANTLHRPATASRSRSARARPTRRR